MRVQGGGGHGEGERPTYIRLVAGKVSPRQKTNAMNRIKNQVGEGGFGKGVWVGCEGWV